MFQRIAAVALALCAAVVVFMEPAAGGLSPDSVHRMGSRDSRTLQCNSCHLSPDDATPAPSGQRLLWAPQVTARAFAMYRSPTMDAQVGALSGSSVICMSCHDGTIAGNKGLDIGRGGLANDHPVSFRYDSSLSMRDRQLYDPSTAPSGLGGTIEKDMLENGLMQCTSCHVFHQRKESLPNLLRKSNARSALCLTCHDI